MKTLLQIILLASLTGTCGISSGQTECIILPVTNRLLLNPSFAGLNGNTSLYSGLQFFSLSKEEKNHNYFFTYDSYSKKLRGGYALYFFQGLTGKTNSNNTGIGFTFTKPLFISNKGKIIPSVNINYMITARQWYIYAIDKLFPEKFAMPGQQDNKFMRYNTFLPQLGLLWDGNSLRAGLSSAIPIRNVSLHEDQHAEQLPVSFIFYFTKKIKGEIKGLISQQYEAFPGLAVMFSENSLLGYTGVRIFLAKRIYALYIQNNFSRHLHGFTALAGWKLNNLRITFSGGSSYSLPQKKASLHGEVSLGFMIPSLRNENDNPWGSSK